MSGRDRPFEPRDLAVAAALGVLITGGWMGQIEHGVLTDTLPAALAAGFLFLALLVPRRNGDAIQPPAPAAIALAVLALLSVRGPIPEPRTALHLAAAALALAVGQNSRIESIHRRVLLFATLVPLTIAAWQRWVLFPELAPLLTGEARDRLLSGRVFSVFILPAQFSAWTAMVLPLVLATAMTGPGKVFARIVTVGLVAAFALAGSLSGPVAAAPVLAWFHGRGRPAALALVILAAVITFALLTRPEARSLTGGGSSFGLRAATWSCTLAGIAEAPIAGHGAGTFATLYRTRYWQPGADEVRHPHSWPLLLWFEHGIAGLGAWLLLAGTLLSPIRDRAARAGAAIFLFASLLDVADRSGTLLTLGALLLGLSLAGRSPRGASPRSS